MRDTLVLGTTTWFLLNCAPVPRVPMVWRPDTRALTGVVFDSATIRQTVELMRSAFPNERAVCFYGELLDSTIDGSSRRLVFVRSMRPAIEDSANEFRVWFHDRPRSGCAGDALVGIAHDHPHAVQIRPCTHSDPDSNVLFNDTRVLFTMVFCADGRAEVFYQDGRRSQDMWYRRTTPP